MISPLTIQNSRLFRGLVRFAASKAGVRVGNLLSGIRVDLDLLAPPLATLGEYHVGVVPPCQVRWA